MADFEKAVSIILKHEGLFVDHPSDPGGATNRGIIFKLFKRYAAVLEVPPTVEALKALTEHQAKQIYKMEFWDRMQGDKFTSQKVANIVFDFFVNAGKPALVKLQVTVGAWADGVIGPETLQAVNNGNETIIFEEYKQARIDFYNQLVERKPKLAVFHKGWLNRVNSFV